MKSLQEIIDAIEDITDTFEGSFSLKNPHGRYFFANPHWLKELNLKWDDVIDKTDEELFSPENAAFAKKSDREAMEKRTPVEYENHIVLNEQPISYYAIKWVFFLPHGKPFCLCTLADYLVNKEKVQGFQKKIDSYFEVAVLSD